MRRVLGRLPRLGASLLWCLSAAFGVSCGDVATGSIEPAPGQPGPTDTGAATGAPAVAVPAVAAPAAAAGGGTYIYTPVGKRDPVKSFYKEDKKPGVSDKGANATTILQVYEIDQLKLIAVVSGIPQPKAMVVTPDGRGHTVKIGTLIGKNFGRVVRIKTSEVVIAEDYRDPIGRKVTNYITMALEVEKKD
jgi:type IV pilus assembly protein PilP